ncbi:hypothetical protein Gohar_026982 [Gossypium harknessii]|uniref:pyruvate kinase n=1 Tax=Gossypium harknessii TaxID=34285 RepID=A0A7J9HTB3_9ROSI|nr:hypothetical protein [Gossypium harknessii]
MSQSLQFITPSRAPYFTLPKFPRRSCTRFPVINLPNTKRSITITPSLSSFLHATSSRSLPSGNSQTGAAGVVSALSVGATGIEVDAVTEAELKENGFRSTRRTKLICTIGPATCGFEQLEALAVGGMNVARINMCHGSREWHQTVIERVRRLNDEKGFAVAIMMDTEGSEIHMGDLGGAASAKTEDGEIWTFSVRAFGTPRPERTINVNYDGFAEDVKVGDELLVDGGMVRFEVTEKIGPDVKCRCTDPGLLLPQANLTLWRNGSLVSERNAMLPTISSKGNRLETYEQIPSEILQFYKNLIGTADRRVTKCPDSLRELLQIALPEAVFLKIVNADEKFEEIYAMVLINKNNFVEIYDPYQFQLLVIGRNGHCGLNGGNMELESVGSHVGGLGMKDSEDWNRASMRKHIKTILVGEGFLWISGLQAYALKGNTLWQVSAQGDKS